MLEITNLRDGAVLNHHHGVETDDFLEIEVTGLAAPQAQITVNGQPAKRSDRNFSAKVKLTEKINKITVKSDDYFGEKSLVITVAWDKKSTPRYNFFIDDCVFFLRWIAKERPQSIFDERVFLGRLKDIHDKYGTKFLLNLFFADDHHKDFTLADMPEDYKAEFQANSDWLKMSFHAKSEFPDRPYQHDNGTQMAADYDEIYREVCRFAGKESFMPPMVFHWAITNQENFHVLQERGTRCLAGGFIGSIAHIGEEHCHEVTDIGYHYEKDVAYYIRDKHLFYDRFFDIFLLNNICCCNYDDTDVLQQKFADVESDRDTLSLMTHEQYSFPEYFNYIPNHLERIDEACRLATEKGFKPCWFPCGLLGNEIWDK